MLVVGKLFFYAVIMVGLLAFLSGCAQSTAAVDAGLAVGREASQKALFRAEQVVCDITPIGVVRSYYVARSVEYDSFCNSRVISPAGGIGSE